MFGKSLPSTIRSGHRGQPRQELGREGRCGLEEVREDHGGVQVDAGVLLGQVQELAILGGTQMGDDGGQLGMAAHDALELVRAGEAGTGNRAAADVHHDRNAGLGEQPPDRVEDRLAQIESAHLRVDLEDPGTAVQGGPHLIQDTVLGEEGGARRRSRALLRPVRGQSL